MKPGLTAFRSKLPDPSGVLRRHSHSFQPPALDKKLVRAPKGRQALFVGNINPTTSYELLRETFKSFPSFAGFRMTRHPTSPVGFVQFKDIKSAVIAYQRLKHTTLVVEGMKLDIRYAEPRKVHPASQPLVNCDPGDEESSTPRPAASGIGPTNSLLIRPKSMQIVLRRSHVKKLLDTLPGLRAVRFRSKVMTLCFVEFDSVEHATQAMKKLQRSGKLKDYIILYAPTKIKREATDHLLLRVSLSNPEFDEKGWKKAASAMPGLSKLRRHVPQDETLDDLWVAKFDSVEAARRASEEIEANPNILQSTEASFFVPEQRGNRVGPKPSNSLYISNIAQGTFLRDLLRPFSEFPGFQKLILARPSSSQVDPEVPSTIKKRLNAGWAIANFKTVADAQRALVELNGKNCAGSQLQVSFKDDRNASSSNAKSQPVMTNALFCRELFGVTPDQVQTAFARFEGLQRAQLYPNGKGGFMPYAKVIFDSPTSASKALQTLSSSPIKIGRSDLPVVVEPLRLRKGRRHWKWTRLLR